MCPKTEETALSSFLASKSVADGRKYAEKGAQKPDHFIRIGSYDPVGGIDTNLVGSGWYDCRFLPEVQPFFQKSRAPTVAKEFQIGLYDPAEADLEHFWNCCSAGFLGERL